MISWQLIVIAIALGCDAFSVAIGIGAVKLTGRRLFRLAWHFGLFQFFMPLIGLAIGQITAEWLGKAGQWVAAALLVLIGANMIRQAVHTERTDLQRYDPTRGWWLIVLSLSTSVDALVAGFGLGLLGVNILAACLIIGLTAAGMTIVGMLIGAGVKRVVGRRAEIFGGGVLIIIALIFVIR